MGLSSLQQLTLYFPANFFILEYHPDKESPRKDIMQEPLMAKDGYILSHQAQPQHRTRRGSPPQPPLRGRGSEFHADGSVGFI